ncbi:MAG: hypothetical protein E7549_01980 [Ruminococcaceae bacterium]|nr:hypothetical protein [Oscillospiraceae bacterium]
MQFAQMERGGRYTKEVADFSGGLNTGEPPSRLDDRALPDCLNVYWREGLLGTRPALRFDDTEHGTVIAAFETADGEYLFVYTAQDVLVYYQNALVLSKPTDDVSVHSHKHVLFCESGKNSVLMFVTEMLEGAALRRTPYEIVLDKEKTQIQSLLDDYYAPLVFVNGRGTTSRTEVGSTAMYEGFNLLTDAYRAQWTTDGTATYFRPPVAAGGGTFKAEYTHTDGKVYTFTVSANGGSADVFVKSTAKEIPDVGNVYLQVGELYGDCSFHDAETHVVVALPEVGFAGNLVINGWRQGADVSKVFDMSFSTWFGGDNSGYGGGTRLFLGGNTNEPHLVRYSDVNNPLYFPENNFMYVGDRSQAVTAFAKQNGTLVIFKERELYGCEYAYTAVSDEALAAGETVDVTAAAYFPLTQLHPAVGCDLPRTVQLCGNRLVWATRDGAVYMLSALNAWSETAVRCISHAVRPTLKAMLTNEACAARYHGNYLLFCGREVLLFDYMSGGFAGFASYADDKKAGANIPWYRWALPCAVSRVLGRDDAVSVFTADGASAHFGDGDRDGDGTPIESRIVTKPFSLGADTRRKSVYALWLHLADTGAAVQVTPYGDGVGNAVPYTVETACNDAREVSPYTVPCRQRRIRTLGVTLTSDTPMALSGLTMEFCTLGAVK